MTIEQTLKDDERLSRKEACATTEELGTRDQHHCERNQNPSF